MVTFDLPDLAIQNFLISARVGPLNTWTLRGHFNTPTAPKSATAKIPIFIRIGLFDIFKNLFLTFK